MTVEKLWQDHSRAGEDDDANTQHRRLSLVQEVLQSNLATERLLRLGSTVAALD
jgi:hypothetical protein